MKPRWAVLCRPRMRLSRRPAARRAAPSGLGGLPGPLRGPGRAHLRLSADARRSAWAVGPTASPPSRAPWSTDAEPRRLHRGPGHVHLRPAGPEPHRRLRVLAGARRERRRRAVTGPRRRRAEGREAPAEKPAPALLFRRRRRRRAPRRAPLRSAQGAVHPAERLHGLVDLLRLLQHRAVHVGRRAPRLLRGGHRAVLRRVLRHVRRPRGPPDADAERLRRADRLARRRHHRSAWRPRLLVTGRRRSRTCRRRVAGSGRLASFSFAACGAIRLARFNVLAARGLGSSKYFVGLPIPGAAMVVVSLVLAQSKMIDASVEARASVVALVVVLSYLMVSRVRFRTFKDFRPSVKSTPMLAAASRWRSPPPWCSSRPRSRSCSPWALRRPRPHRGGRCSSASARRIEARSAPRGRRRRSSDAGRADGPVAIVRPS